jgi:4'-phosphopantetheinyl transferase
MVRVTASEAVAPCVEAAAEAYRSRGGATVQLDTAAVGAESASAAEGAPAPDVLVGTSIELTRAVEGGSAVEGSEVDLARIPWVLEADEGLGVRSLDDLKSSTAEVWVLGGPAAYEARRAVSARPATGNVWRRRGWPWCRCPWRERRRASPSTSRRWSRGRRWPRERPIPRPPGRCSASSSRRKASASSPPAARPRREEGSRPGVGRSGAVLTPAGRQEAPAAGTLGDDEVHVWRAGLDLDPADHERLRAFLSADESARADRFLRPEHRRRFANGRGLVRQVLAGYLETEPGRIRFVYGPQGKPGLPATALRFNLSHSGGRALLAVTRGRELGVDIERIRPEIDCLGIARRVFSEAEQRALRAVPEPLRRRAFFAAWTRKEAYVKARGGGLSIPLRDFDVSLAPGEPPALLRAPDPGEIDRLQLEGLDVEDGFMAALVVEGRGLRLRSITLPGPAAASVL